MKSYRKIFFVIFYVMYLLGIIAGGISQTKQENQEELYQYLEKAVSEYDVTARDGIFKIGRENLVYFSLCAAGAVFKLAVPGIAICLFARGYAAGFAMTSVLRLYGFKGAILSAANVISLSLVVPLLCLCGTAIIENVTENRFDRKRFLKCGLILIVFICGIFLADCILRGGLAAVFTKFAAGVLK